MLDFLEGKIMTLLASSTLLFDYQLSEVIKLTREMGYDGVEIWHFHLERTHENPDQLAKLAEQTHSVLSIHALSWDLNYCSRLPDIREASIQALKKSIALTRDIGARTVVVHPGRVTIPNDTPEANWPFLIEGTQRLANYAEELGVTLSLEIMEHIPKEFFINPHDAQYLLQFIKSSTINIFHLNKICLNISKQPRELVISILAIVQALNSIYLWEREPVIYTDSSNI